MGRSRAPWGMALSLIVLLAGCGAAPAPAGQQSAVDLASAEATAIIERAQATVLVLQAQAQATALIARAGNSPATAAPAPSTPLAQATVAVPTAGLQPPPPGEENVARATPTPALVVSVTGVSYAADGGYILVGFFAPPHIAQQWWQGNVSVIDEATGTVYDEIPVLPSVGPLIGRPVEQGQAGYVMLVNIHPGLPPGSLVTVVLDEYRFEHLTIR